MSKRLKIAVLMGGRTPEYEISIISGQSVTKALEEKGHIVLPIIVSRDGQIWKSIDPDVLYKLPNPLLLKGTNKEIISTKTKSLESPTSIKHQGVDVIFPAMHGPFGEDGTIQGLLDVLDIPYIGSGVLASAIGMNKYVFRKILNGSGIQFPKFIALKKNDDHQNFKKILGNMPYFVKPNSQGSSVGASLVTKASDLKAAISKALQYGDTVLIDEYIKGTELTCGVIGNDELEALPVVEIVTESDFFDYNAKYTTSTTQEIVPARISPELTKKVQELAKRVYLEIGARGFARVDFILRNNELYVLEINTIPGLTPMSLMPKAAKVAGYSYSDLVEKVVELALTK